MSAHRDFAIELSEEQMSFEKVRTAFGVWNDVMYQLRDSAYVLRSIGEERQSDAMFIDADSMARRARMHLNNITLRERTKLEQLTRDESANPDVCT